MSILKNVLIKVSGNHLIQTLLEKNVFISQFLMGIGSGGSVSSNGEQAIMQFLLSQINPPYCIFDVGSNKGQFLKLILNNILIDGYSIHCFEPGRETFEFLSSSSPKDPRLILNNIGLGKDKNEAILHYDKVGSGIASLTKRKLDYFNIEFAESEKVQIDTIDSYCSENGISHIHLLTQVSHPLKASMVHSWLPMIST